MVGLGISEPKKMKKYLGASIHVIKYLLANVESSELFTSMMEPTIYSCLKL